MLLAETQARIDTTKARVWRGVSRIRLRGTIIPKRGVVNSRRMLWTERGSGSDREAREEHLLDRRVEDGHVDGLFHDGDTGLQRTGVAADGRPRDDDHRHAGVSLAHGREHVPSVHARH